MWFKRFVKKWSAPTRGAFVSELQKRLELYFPQLTERQLWAEAYRLWEAYLQSQQNQDRLILWDALKEGTLGTFFLATSILGAPDSIS